MADKHHGNEELSLIGSGTTVEGKISTEGSIRIDGALVGDLVTKANAAVGLSGVIEGTLTAQNVTLAGKVSGTVTATDKLVLESKCVIKGDIRATRLVVDEGASLNGQCSMPQSSPGGKHGS
jgi:cytoskeletal protein CcmA (bactofilin family)